MSSKQCSECKSMVAESKAFCPDCDAPMDAEQKRHDSSEYDAQMKTVNLTGTSQRILMEQLNLSTFFNLPRPNIKAVENELKPNQSNGTEIQPTFVQYNHVNNLKETPNISPQPEAIIFREPPTNIAVEPAENVTNSRKIFYIVGGISLVVLLFAVVIVIGAAIFSIYYFNLSK